MENKKSNSEESAEMIEIKKLLFNTELGLQGRISVSLFRARTLPKEDQRKIREYVSRYRPAKIKQD